MTQTPKLRINVMTHRNRIAAWFPDQPYSGKLFVPGNDDPAAALEFVTRFMYERRLRKIWRGVAK